MQYERLLRSMRRGTSDPGGQLNLVSRFHVPHPVVPSLAAKAQQPANQATSNE